jgi:hypothetical protein
MTPDTPDRRWTPPDSVSVEDRGYETPCWIWQRGTNSRGYPRLHVHGGRFYAHRYYYEFWVGDIPEGHEVHHRCEQILCVRPDHLVPLPNMEHRREHQSILSAEDVAQIRALAADNHWLVEIADRFGVSPGHVSRVVNREKWASVPTMPAANPRDPAWLETEEAGEILGCSSRTVKRMITSGSLEGRRIKRGRVSPWEVSLSSVKRMIAERRVS